MQVRKVYQEIYYVKEWQNNESNIMNTSLQIHLYKDAINAPNFFLE